MNRRDYDAPIQSRLGMYGTVGWLAERLLETDPISVGEWQALDVSRSRAHDMHEVLDVRVQVAGHLTLDDFAAMPGLNRPWADQHFKERVGGQPVNPPPSHVNWPWGRNANAQHRDGEQFSHTYPERMWPKHAGHEPSLCQPEFCDYGTRLGIRYELGDLWDVVQMLRRSPMTRQAYLPIWFPEDTGATHGKRVPCTLGYHFLIRNNELSCRYYIRSCDLIRHFADDIYLALRLMDWVISHLSDTEDVNDPLTKLTRGDLIMYVSNLHAFRGDRDKLINLMLPPDTGDYHNPTGITGLDVTA